MAADGQEVPDTSVFLQVVDDLLEAPTYHVISEAAFGANTLTKQASAELNIAFTVVCKRSVIFKCEMAQIWQLFDCSKEVMLGKVPINIPLSREDFCSPLLSKCLEFSSMSLCFSSRSLPRMLYWLR
jgi:hypothetical protein